MVVMIEITAWNKVLPYANRVLNKHGYILHMQQQYERFSTVAVFAKYGDIPAIYELFCEAKHQESVAAKLG